MRTGDGVRAAAWACAAVLAGRHTVGAWQLAGTVRWLRTGPFAVPNTPRSVSAAPPARTEGSVSGDAPAVRRPCVRVVVPVLREQAQIQAMVAWWAQRQRPGWSVSVVSTSREQRERDQLAAAVAHGGVLDTSCVTQFTDTQFDAVGRVRGGGGLLTPEDVLGALARTPLTGDVVDRVLAEQRATAIRHLVYPGHGRKAAQVNHAARIDPKFGYLAVFDVDSRPTDRDLDAAEAVMAHAEMGDVVQQHALFAAPSRREIGGVLVRGSATLQSLWTMRREIPYARRHQAWARRPGPAARVRAGLAQPVGHGLYLSREAFERIGGFPEDTVLDDVPAGVAVTLHRLHTRSVPLLAVVPAAPTTGEVLAQGRRWFCSYLDYPRVLRAAARGGAGSRAHRGWLALVAAYRGVAWLAASPVTAVALATAVHPRTGRALRATAAGGLALATVAPVALTAGARGTRPTAAVVLRDGGELLAAYLVRSVGPWFAVADAARGRHPSAPGAFAPKAHDRGAV